MLVLGSGLLFIIGAWGEYLGQTGKGSKGSQTYATKDPWPGLELTQIAKVVQTAFFRAVQEGLHCDRALNGTGRCHV